VAQTSLRGYSCESVKFRVFNLTPYNAYFILLIIFVNFVNIKQVLFALLPAEFCQFRSFVFCKVMENTFKVWRDIWRGCCCKFHEEYHIEKELKIGNHVIRLYRSKRMMKLQIVQYFWYSGACKIRCKVDKTMTMMTPITAEWKSCFCIYIYGCWQGRIN